MPQLLLPGIPEGAIRINPVVSHLSKDGHVTWLVGSDNYFFHRTGDSAGHRLALATLMTNGHARPCEIQKALGTPHRSLMRWRSQLEEHGPGSFYQPQAVRGATVLTAEKSAECQRLLDDGHSIAATARLADIGESTLRKAITAGRVTKTQSIRPATPPADSPPSTKSQRSQRDAATAEGIGIACTRADERTAAAFGLADSATTRFEPANDLILGGLLCGLPALCANGLFSGLGRHLALPKGYYSALHILCVLGFMALARIRRPEQLRHHPPASTPACAATRPNSEPPRRPTPTTARKSPNAPPFSKPSKRSKPSAMPSKSGAEPPRTKSPSRNSPKPSARANCGPWPKPSPTPSR